jgi:hypothetical protein
MPPLEISPFGESGPLNAKSIQPEFAKPNDEANLAHQLVLLEEPPS